tara:strand:- start:174 stop:368 length:195 start_codon:yes stop_codon:yes gene_type:complete
MDSLCCYKLVVGKKIIKCSQCKEEFENGYGYRMHWEQKHFYPYIRKNSFDFESAKRDKENGANS